MKCSDFAVLSSLTIASASDSINVFNVVILFFVSGLDIIFPMFLKLWASSIISNELLNVALITLIIF